MTSLQIKIITGTKGTAHLELGYFITISDNGLAVCERFEQTINEKGDYKYITFTPQRGADLNTALDLIAHVIDTAASRIVTTTKV